LTKVGITDEGLLDMTEPQIFKYSVYVGTMDNGQEILVQIFTDSDSGDYLMGQIAFRTASSSWGVPYPLEKK
jgi:hypothetical protein